MQPPLTVCSELGDQSPSRCRGELHSHIKEERNLHTFGYLVCVRVFMCERDAASSLSLNGASSSSFTTPASDESITATHGVGYAT